MAAEDYLPEADEFVSYHSFMGPYFSMLKKNKKLKIINNKYPILIKCGKHLINPTSVRCITQVREALYIVKFNNEFNSEYACWIEKKDINFLLKHFNILVPD